MTNNPTPRIDDPLVERAGVHACAVERDGQAGVEGGWIVTNGSGDMFRTWEFGGPVWTDDREQATRYARREDAEAVHAEDEDAWSITPYAKGMEECAVPGCTTPTDKGICHACDKWVEDEAAKLSAPQVSDTREALKKYQAFRKASLGVIYAYRVCDFGTVPVQLGLAILALDQKMRPFTDGSEPTKDIILAALSPNRMEAE